MSTLASARDINAAAKPAFANHRATSNDYRAKRRLPRRQLARSTSNSDAEATDRDSGCALEEYTWVPPNLTPEQVLKVTQLCLFFYYLILIFIIIYFVIVVLFVLRKMLFRDNTLIRNKFALFYLFRLFIYFLL